MARTTQQRQQDRDARANGRRNSPPATTPNTPQPTRAERRAARQEARNQRRDAQDYRVPGFQGGVQGVINQATNYNADITRQQNRTNNISESNPYGSSSYTYDNEGNITGREIKLDPAQQRTLDLQNQQSARALELSGNAMNQLQNTPALNFSGLPSAGPERTGQFQAQGLPQVQQERMGQFNPSGLPGVNRQDVGRFSAQGLQSVDPVNDNTRQRVEQSYFDRGARLLDKQFSKAANEETANLRARGYQFGGDDYNKLYNERVADPRNQAMNDLAQRAVEAGGAEQQRINQMQLNTRGQQFGEQNTSFGTNMAANAQDFGQSLAANQNAYNQASNTYQNNLAGSAQNFGQSLAANQNAFNQQNTTYGNNMAANAQNFGQGMASRQQGINEQLTMRNQPLQEAQALNSLNYGVQNPTFNPYQAAQNPGVDVAGMGMGMMGAQQNWRLQQDQQAHDRWMMQNTPRGGGGGGGTDPNEWYNRAIFSQMLGSMGQSQQQQPSLWGQVGAGLAQGAGNAFGNYIGGSF